MRENYIVGQAGHYNGNPLYYSFKKETKREVAIAYIKKVGKKFKPSKGKILVWHEESNIITAKPTEFDGKELLMEIENE